MSQFLWYDCTFKKQCTVPVTLTFDLWKSMFFQWIDNDPISVMYEFQIDISTNSSGGRRSPAVACWASDHWVASSNPLRGKFRH